MVAALVTLGAIIVLTVLLVGIGLLVTASSFSPSIIRWDASISSWLALHRTPTLNTWTDVASIAAGSGTILTIAGISVAVLLLRRHRYAAGLVICGLVIEAAAFLATTLLIDRPRPTVGSLDALPITSSFPSGHMAASIVLYVSLAIVISRLAKQAVITVVVWCIALVIPLAVGFSRVYRGLHHPSDVLASVVLGIGAIAFATAAMQTIASAHDRREADRRPEPRPITRERVGS